MIKLMCRTVLLIAIGLSWFSGAMADLNDGLVAYYPFDGNAQDESGNGNNGIEYGGVTYESGVIGMAANFDGIDAYIQITPKSEVSKIGDFTIVTWVFLEDWKKQNPNLDRQYIFDGHAHSSTTTSDFSIPGFCLIYDRRDSREEIHNFIMFDNGSRLMEQNTQVSIGRSWHQLLLMRKGKNDFTYFDGELLSVTYARELATDDPLNMAHDWFIGTFSGNNPHYNGGTFNYSFFGLIDDLRIYNRALSDSEVQQLYQMDNQPSDDCWAIYENGNLHIPCIKVKGPFDDDLHYEADMQYEPLSDPMTFQVTGVKPK